MIILIYGIAIALLAALRNLFYSKTENISSNTAIMTMTVYSILCGLVYIIFNYRLIIYIIINGLKGYPLSSLFNFLIASFLNLFGFLYFFNSFFHKERTNDTNLITISLSHTLPIIITGFIYYIMELETYKIQTYFGILALLLGNIGLIKYWSK